jgi:hypothetical protein
VTVPAARAGAVVRSSAVVGVALSLFTLAGCGHDRSAAPPRPAAADSGSTQRQVERALLTRAELPLGFDRQDGGRDTTAIGCAGIDRLYLPQDATARATVTFGHALSAAFVNETIAVQPGKAASNVDGLRRAPQDCRQFSGPGQIQYQVSALTGIPSYGDATGAVRVTSRLPEARPVDLVAVRLGDTVVLVAHADVATVDTDLTRTILSRAVDKARHGG